MGKADGEGNLSGNGKLSFSVFNPHKEVQFELRASLAGVSSSDADEEREQVDLGSAALSIVAAFDARADSHWCVMKDRYGRRNNNRIQVCGRVWLTPFTCSSLAD